MAITYVSAASAASNTVNLPTFQAGDVAFVVALRSSSATVPTVPAGWTSMGTYGTTYGAALGYRYLQSADTSIGTWTNSEYVGVVVYRGAHATLPWDAPYWGGGNGLLTASSSVTGGLTTGAYETSTGLYLALLASTTVSSAGSGTLEYGAGTRFGVTDAANNGTVGLYTFSGTGVVAQAYFGIRAADTFPIVADQDTTSGTVTSNSSSWTLTYPTNIAAGDLLLAFVAYDGASAITSIPSGWIYSYNGPGATVIGWAKKKATGSETGTFTLGLGGSEQGAWVLYRIPAGTWEGSLGTVFSNDERSGSVVYLYDATGSPSLYPDPPSLDPYNWATEDTLWFAVTSVDTSRTVSSYPSGMTNTGYLASGGSTGATLGWARLESAVGSYDPGTFTISNSDDWAAATIAVRPAPQKVTGSFTADAIIKKTQVFAPTIAKSTYDSGSTGSVTGDGNWRTAQSFKASIGALASVTHAVAKTGNPLDDLFLYIYDDDAGTPGTPLYEIDSVGGVDLTTTFTSRTVNPNLQLTPGTTYWFRWTRTGSELGGDYYRVARSLNDYADGARAYWYYSTGLWTVVPAEDLYFEAVFSSLTFAAEIVSGGGVQTKTGSLTASATVKRTQSSSLTANADLKKTSTPTGLQADAFLKKTITGTLIANAVRKATIAPSFTADAVKRYTHGGPGDLHEFTANAIIKANSGTKTFTADGWKKATIAGFLTANAIVKASSGIKTFAADASIKKTQAGSSSANAVIKATSATKTYTADAWIKTVVFKSLSADAAKKASSGTKTFSADAFITKTTLASLSANAAIKKTQSFLLAADGIKKASSGTKTFIADASFKKTISSSLTGAAVVKAPLASSLAANAVVKKTQPFSFSFDAVIKASSGTQTFSADALKSAGQVTETGSFSADAVRALTTSTGFSANAWLARIEVGSFAASATVKRTVLGSFGADALKRQSFAWTFASAAVLRSSATGIFTADGVLLKARLTSLSNDAVIKSTRTSTFAAAAILRSSPWSSFSSDSVIRSTRSSSFSVAATLRASIASSFLANAALLRAAAGIASADAILRRAQGQTFTADAWGQLRPVGTWTADATLGKTSVLGLSAEAWVIGGHEGSLSADAVIWKQSSGSLTADAAVRQTRTAMATADGVFHRVASASLTAEAIFAQTKSGALLADASITRSSVGSFSADAVRVSVGRAMWTTPLSLVQISESPTFAFTMPATHGHLHFQMEIDLVDTFDSADLRVLRSSVDQTGWEFWDGAGWQPIPQEGVPDTYAGNEARYAVGDPLTNGTWYRRVRAGVL